MANEFVTRTGLIVSGSTFLPAVTTASKGYILSFDDTTKQVYYMSTSSVTVTVPGSDTQIIYNNGGAFGAASNFVFSGSNVGIGTTSPSAKLTVKGSGTTSSTTALLIQNANASSSLIVKDDGQIQVSSTSVANPGYSFIDNTDTGLYMLGGTMGTVVDGQYSILYGADGPSLYSNTTNSITSANLLMAKIGSNHRMSIWMNGSNNFQFQAWESGVGYNNNIILQELGGNVGIGTSSPSYKLDVYGSPRFYGDGNHIYTRIFSGASNKDSKILIGNDAERFNIGLAASSNTFSINSSNGGTPTSINIDYTTGNVGIGTTSPSTKFAVSNAGASGLEVDPTGGVNSGVLLQAYNRSTSAYMAQSYYALSHTFNVGSGAGTRVLDIISGGRVGINTSSPASTLDVYASSSTDYIIATFGNNNSNVYGVNQFKSGSTITGYLGWHQSGYFFQSANNVNSEREMMLQGVDGITLGTNNTGSLSIKGTTADIITDSKVKVGIGTSTPNAKLDVNGNVLVTGSLTVSGSSTFTNIGPAVFTGSITQNASTASFGGLVGIGTTTPAAKLHTIGTGIVNIVQSSNDVSYTQYYNTSTSSGSTNDGLTVGVNGLDAYVYNRETSNLILGTADTERMRITSTGNVGIGETSPSFKLVVTDTNNYQGILVNGNNAPVIAFDRSTGQTAEWKVGISGNDGNSFSVSSGTAATDLLFISSSGNVGIGTTSPATKLDINSGTAATALRVLSTNTTSLRTFFEATSGNVEQHFLYTGNQDWVLGLDKADSNKFKLASADDGFASAKLTVTTAGNVGIGITTPSALLHIAKNATYNNVSNTALRVANVTSPNKAIDFGYDNTADVGYIQGIEFGVAAKNLSLQSDGGNVGIGTTSPSYKLDVNGTGRFVGNSGAPALQIIDGGSTFGVLGISGSQAGDVNWLLMSGYPSAGNFTIRQSDTVNALVIQKTTGAATFSAGVTAASFTGSFSGSVSAPGSTTQIVYNSGGALAADSGLVYSGSVVGIGTATPSSGTKLQVDGNIYSNNVGGNAFSINSVGANYGFILNNSANTFSLGYGSSLGTLGTSVLTWNSSGNVGIGTTTPSTALTVAGAISSSGATYVGGNLSVGTTYNGFAANISGTTYVIGASVWVNDGYGYANASSGGTGFFPSSSTAISINSGGNTRMFIASGSGNVGIGTTSPANNLHVYGTGDQIIKIENSGTYLMYLGLVSNEGYIGSTNATPLTFYTNNVNRMYITTGGNVGIGTTSPSSLLNIVAAGSNSSALVVQDDARKVKIGRDQIEVTDLSDAASTMYLQPNSNLVINSSAGNVGIGTQPSAKLHVKSSNIVQRLESNASYTQLDFYNTSYNSTNSRNWAIGANLYNYGDFNIMASATSASAPNASYTYLTINKDGNVGIGTVNPSEKLHVAGAALIDNYLYLDSNEIWAKNGGDLFAKADNKVYIQPAASTTAVFDTNGNVGIGTTSPGAKLDVYGVASSDTTPGLRVLGNDWGSVSNAMVRFDGGPASDGNILLLKSQNNNRSDSEIFEIQNSGSNTVFVVKGTGNVGIGTLNPSYNLHVSSSGYYGGNLTVEGTITAQKLNVQQITSSVVYSSGSNIFGNNLANTQTFTGSIQATGSSHYFLGDVGIGITSPNSYNGYSTLTLNGSTGGVVDFESGGSRIATINNPGSGLDIYTMVSAPIVFGTDITARMTITGGGNVGIGTSSPKTKFQVNNGHIAAYYTSASNGTQLYLGDTNFDNSNYWNSAPGIGAVYSSATTVAGDLAFYVYTGVASSRTEVIRVLSSGNVGIGTTSPSYTLDVAGTSRSDLYIFRSNQSAPTADAFIFRPADNTVALGTANTERMRITSAGYVGIGTTNPTQYSSLFPAQLAINANSTVDGIFSTTNNSSAAELVLFKKSTTNDFGSLLIQHSGSTGRAIELNYGVNMSTGVGGTTSYFVNTTGSGYYAGNVGIGTTSPGAPLDVNGSLNSGKSIIRVTNSDTANYITLGAGIPGVSNAGMNFTLDSSSKMVISAGGNVGIGTTSPAQKLDVAGGDIILSSNATYIRSKDASGNTPRMFGINPSNDTYIGPIDSYAGGAVFYGVSANVASQTFYTGATARLHIASGGNVGIGTTTPSQKLEIFGLSDVALRIHKDSVGEAIVGISGSVGASTTQFITNTNGFDFRGDSNTFPGGGSSRLFISSSGNVGIGTASPARKLDVNGTSIFRDFTTVVSSNGNPVSNTTWLSSDSGITNIYTGGNSTVQLNSNGVSYFNGGNVGIGTSTPTGRLTVAPYNTVNSSSIEFTDADNAVISSYYSQTFAVDNTNTQSGRQFVFAKGGKGYGTQTKTMMVIDADSGNVGIGTTSPESRLHIAQSNAGGKVTLYIDNDASSTLNNEATIKFSVDSGASATVGGAEISTINVNAGNGNSDLTFKTFNASSGLTEKVRITSGGNVGIGTTNPSSKLDVSVVPSAAWMNLINANEAEFRLTTFNNGTNNGSAAYAFKHGLYYNTTENAAVTFYRGTSSTGGFLTFTTDTGIERMRIDGSGNVGIGTTSPSQKLDVNGNIQGTTGVTLTGNAAKVSTTYGGVTTTNFFTDAGGGVISVDGSNKISLRQGGVSGTDAITIAGSGNVGIGTTTPNQKLSVEGGSIYLNANNAAANYYLYINKKSGQDGGILFNRDNTNDWQLTNGAGNGDLIFYSYGISNDAVTFKRATGNVGIGTTTPTQRLHASGAIAIEAESTTTKYSTTFSGSLTTNTNIASIPTGSFKAAFFDYYVASGSVNMRAGTVMAVHNNSTSRYTDTSTADIGTTAPVDFSTSIVAGSLVLTANIASGTWEIKTAYRAL